MHIWFYFILFSFPLVGGLLGYYTQFKNMNTMRIMLAFAGAYLLSVVLFHLIPHLYIEMNVLSGVLLLSGFFFQVGIERFSRGVEHGHMHSHHKKGSTSKFVPYEILISLSLHSFMEGMPLGGGFLDSGKVQLSFLFGIVLHELPACFAMVSILKTQNHFAKYKLLTFVIIYSSMSSLGAITGTYLNEYINPEIFEYIMAFVVGTFLHIATTILFENSENHRFSTAKIIAILIGIGMAALVSLG